MGDASNIQNSASGRVACYSHWQCPETLLAVDLEPGLLLHAQLKHGYSLYIDASAVLTEGAL